jgi:hypothetical protein
MGARTGIAWRWPGSGAPHRPPDPSTSVIADDPAALVLLGGILLVIGVVLPRLTRRWRKGGANVKKR